MAPIGDSGGDLQSDSGPKCEHARTLQLLAPLSSYCSRSVSESIPQLFGEELAPSFVSVSFTEWFATPSAKYPVGDSASSVSGG